MSPAVTPRLLVLWSIIALIAVSLPAEAMARSDHHCDDETCGVQCDECPSPDESTPPDAGASCSSDCDGCCLPCCAGLVYLGAPPVSCEASENPRLSYASYRDDFSAAAPQPIYHPPRH
jgi:hypothetical protein